MKSAKSLSLFRIWDIILLVVILALVGLCLWSYLSSERGESADIYLDGEKYLTLSLLKDQVIELEHLRIVVKDRTIWVEDADCRDKICEQRGAISKKGQSIVCAPNRVVIKITGKGEVEAIS